MESGEQDTRRGVLRPSRLPVPRAALATSVQSNSDNNHQGKPQIPRPVASRVSKLHKISLHTNTTSDVTQSKIESNGPPTPRNISSVDRSETFRTQPTTNTDEDIHIDNFETIPAQTPDGHRDKRRPRPSLSERTVETLSQLTPSPSPSRRRLGNVDWYGIMAPPLKPMSALRSSQSNGSLRARQPSPTKHPQPAIARDGPANPRTVLSASSDRSSILKTRISAPKCSGPAIIKTQQTGTRPDSTRCQAVESSTDSTNHASSPSRTKSFQNLRMSTSNSSALRGSSVTAAQSLKKPTSNTVRGIHPAKPRQKAIEDTSLSKHPNSNSKLKPTTPLPKFLADTANVPASAKSSDNKMGSKDPSTSNATKSSLKLRETIARAKAAKREVHNSTIAVYGQKTQTSTPSKHFELPLDGSAESHQDRILQKRIESAVTSGLLNVAALSLKTLPEAIRTMYDFDQTSNFNWAEAVDLIKFNAADNELEVLSDNFFPDWSEEELLEDDNKANVFGGLQVLDFRGNRLLTVPQGLRRLGHLKTLFLANNQLELGTIAVICQLPQLRELHMANNKLEGAVPSSLATLVGLEVLDLHANRISTLPENFSNMTNLQKLDLSDNCLKKVPLDYIHNMPLTELNIAKNNLSGNLFTETYHNPKMQILNIAWNRFTSICTDELDLPRLHTLICDHNQLSSLPPLAKYSSLVTLSASNNRIDFLPTDFTEARNLHSANVSANQIKTLDPLIARMEALVLLNVTANPLRERKYLAMNSDQLKTELAKRLNIDLEDAGIKGTRGCDDQSDQTFHMNTAPKDGNQPVDGILDLSSKRLRSVDLDTTQLSQTVHTVCLAENDLQEFPQELLAHPMVRFTLKHLDISNNQTLHPIRYLTQKTSLPVLESLHMINTGIHSLDALTLHLSAPSLKELNVSRQRLSGPLPSLRESFPCLSILFAADNRFNSVDVDAIRGLEVVDIRNNNIEHLPPKIGELGNIEATRAVSGCLRALECSGNKFRVPRATILDKGTEAVLRDLRRMIPAEQVGSEWRL